MAAYSAAPPDDPFAPSRNMFEALAAGLAGPAAAALTAAGLGELLDERGRDVLRQLLQDHFDVRAAREEQQARGRTGPDGITRTRLETGHGRLLATLFGTVRVNRCAWRKPGSPDYRRRETSFPGRGPRTPGLDRLRASSAPSRRKRLASSPRLTALATSRSAARSPHPHRPRAPPRRSRHAR